LGWGWGWGWGWDWGWGWGWRWGKRVVWGLQGLTVNRRGCWWGMQGFWDARSNVFLLLHSV
jgi:hypothetical protein